ncbi:hypothetical protein LTR85_005322 [Meristemomyces frigidus]|nr:hypothetical protein LTR85_005322 [Meristemomyces frigidus]
MVVSGAVSESLPASESPLLKLPAEIRNAIYTLALVKDEPINVGYFEAFLREPGLLAANRQIRREGMPIFYGANTFISRQIDTATRFLAHLNDDKVKMLQGVAILLALDYGSEELVTVRLRAVDDAVKRWREEHSARGLREDAILVEVTTNAAKDTQWVPAAEFKSWVVMMLGDKLLLFLRNDALQAEAWAKFLWYWDPKFGLLLGCTRWTGERTWIRTWSRVSDCEEVDPPF